MVLLVKLSCLHKTHILLCNIFSFYYEINFKVTLTRTKPMALNQSFSTIPRLWNWGRVGSSAQMSSDEREPELLTRTLTLELVLVGHHGCSEIVKCASEDLWKIISGHIHRRKWPTPVASVHLFCSENTGKNFTSNKMLKNEDLVRLFKNREINI